MSKELSIDQLWNSVPQGTDVYTPAKVAHLPEGAQRYLAHAIAPGAILASAVRLRMHGEIKLREWLPFAAEEVICWERGFVWAATVKMRRFSIRGSDRFLDGVGAMKWKLLGIVPVMSGSGPQVTRSAIGRLQGESVWLPSVLCRDNVRWTEQDPCHPTGHLTVGGESTDLDLAIDSIGRIQSVKLARWGNPGGGEYRYEDFGVVADAEKTFDGYTIPASIRAGWFFGTDRFTNEGEFFRATIDDAQYR